MECLLSKTFIKNETFYCNVLILILMECLLSMYVPMSNDAKSVLILILMECLLRIVDITEGDQFCQVLILILMECLLRN